MATKKIKTTKSKTNSTTREKSKETVLVLRTCGPDMTSMGGFKWPTKGPVSCPDWDPEPVCGHGLHGLLWGTGDASLMDWSDGAKWLVVEVRASSVVPIGGKDSQYPDKVKFPTGSVIFAGERRGATDIIKVRAPAGYIVHGASNRGGAWSTNRGGDGSTNQGGDGSTNRGGVGSTNQGGVGSTNQGGDRSTNRGGDWSTNQGGDGSTNQGGRGSTNQGGRGSTNRGGDGSTNQGGDRSTNQGGVRSTNQGGYGSTNRGGDWSTNQGGDWSTNQGGDGSTNQGGVRSVLLASWYDTEAQRHRIEVGYVGETIAADGKPIQANKPYRLDDDHKFILVKDPA